MGPSLLTSASANCSLSCSFSCRNYVLCLNYRQLGNILAGDGVTLSAYEENRVIFSTEGFSWAKLLNLRRRNHVQSLWPKGELQEELSNVLQCPCCFLFVLPFIFITFNWLGVLPPHIICCVCNLRVRPLLLFFSPAWHDAICLVVFPLIRRPPVYSVY